MKTDKGEYLVGGYLKVIKLVLSPTGRQKKRGHLI
jgi:hypothetical protein